MIIIISPKQKFPYFIENRLRWFHKRAIYIIIFQRYKKLQELQMTTVLKNKLRKNIVWMKMKYYS